MNLLYERTFIQEEILYNEKKPPQTNARRTYQKFIGLLKELGPTEDLANL